MRTSHRPEQATLYQLVQQHAATFIAQAEDAAGADLPQFVKDEFDAFLECGILAHGFQPGQRRQTWKGNCVAIGLASGFLEPLESTSIHLIQRGIIRLMQTFPTAGIRQSDIDEYNQQTRAEIEHIRDFIILHYKVTRREDTPYWRACRELEIPPSLRHRIDLFSESGRVFRIPNELFGENSWIQVVLGQGITPQQHHRVADLMGDAELSRFLDGIKSSVDRTVMQLPAHQAYVETYCAAPRQQATAS